MLCMSFGELGCRRDTDDDDDVFRPLVIVFTFNRSVIFRLRGSIMNSVFETINW